MANRRNRIIYASQSVHAEGRILYRVQTLGSSTTFNTQDIFELGQLNLTDIVDDSPEVQVTLEGLDYGSIYTMATLAKIPVSNLHHNIRQSDGTTFFGTVSGSLEVSEGDLTASGFTGLPANSGTGLANIVVRDEAGGSAIRYYHGVQLVDFGRDCGISKGADIWSPIQAECSLGTANDDIEFTKLLKDVFINQIEFNYQSSDTSSENYQGETEQKQWLLNSARFLSWEEWQVGSLANQISISAFAAKDTLNLSLATPSVVATLEDTNLAFLKKDLAGRPSVLFTFAKGGGLTNATSIAIPVFSLNACIPSNVLQYFLYDSSDNSLAFYSNGILDTLDEVLPAERSAFINGDKCYVVYAANAYAKEVGEAGRPGSADSSYVSAKYFAPIGTEDVESVGGVRQGQVEAYLVDPDLVLTFDLTGATIGATSIALNNTVASNVDLTKFIGAKLRVTAGPGKNGPAREITGATNNISGNFNNGTLNLGGSAWANIRLVESSTGSSTTTTVYVNNLCGIDESFIGSDITVIVAGSPETETITAVDTLNKTFTISAASGAPDNGTEVLVSAEPTTASEVLVGDYELALRLQNVTLTANLTREQLKEIGHLNPYARPVNIPIEFTAAIEATASDLETFAKFSGKGGKFKAGTLTDVDIVDLFSKDNLSIVVMIYQQTDQEAGGTGLDRKVLSPDMFGDEYFVDGIREIYTATDGTLTEYPLKTVVVQNLRITDENTSTPIQGNATQSFSFRGTNELAALRGYVGIQYATKVIESQG